MNEKFSLLILILVSSLVYVLKLIDNEEVKERSKYYIYRRAITGCIGSSLFVILIYQLCEYFELPPTFALAIAGCVGYLGADVLSRLLEMFMTRLIDKVINKF